MRACSGVTSSGRSGIAQRLVKDFFDVRFTNLCQRYLAVFFVDFIIFRIEGTHHLRHAQITFAFIGGRPE